MVNAEIHPKILSQFLEAFTPVVDPLALTIQVSHQELLALLTLTVSPTFALTVPVLELLLEETVLLLLIVLLVPIVELDLPVPL
jgi:hypothetical protein